MSEYQEFTGKSVEEAIKAACDQFAVGLGDLDFEILTPGSRGVLGMGAELARIVAAPRSALGGSAPKREAAEATPLPAPRPHEDRGFGDRDRGPRRDFGDRGPRRDDRGPRRDSGDRGPRRDDRPVGDRPVVDQPAADQPAAERPAADRPAADRPAADRGPRRDFGDRGDRGPRRDSGDRGPRRDSGDRGPRRDDRPVAERPAGEHARGGSELSAAEVAAVTTARGSLAMERAELEAAEASPEALAAGQDILETLMGHLGFQGVTVEIREGETSRLNVVGDGADREALGSLIGRKGERLSALQHLVNLMLSRRTGQWTRVLVDVEDYRGRRERQLVDLATRAAERVAETGKMLQLEPMPALERRWIHIALRDHAAVSTQSIGEEPNRRVVVIPRNP
jgi:spoIIIJ-associated protein